MATMNSLPKKSKAAALAFLVGGLLPVVAFTVVEQFYGPIGGAIAGMLFGAGEIGWELWNSGKVQKITWLSNALVLIFGALSLWEHNGIFFKLQPAVLLLIFALLLFGSSLLKKPFLTALAKKQNPDMPPEAELLLNGMNFRLGFVFLFLTAISVHAALYWSTVAWATLKSVGLPIILGVYMVIEFAWLRLMRGKKK
jgi:intracellular septation protein